MYVCAGCRGHDGMMEVLVFQGRSQEPGIPLLNRHMLCMDRASLIAGAEHR